MNECGPILPEIHLQPLAVGALDDGLDRRVYDSAGMQINLKAFAEKWTHPRKLTRQMTIHRTPASAASSVEVNT
jgi:hypothetical protein